MRLGLLVLAVMVSSLSSMAYQVSGKVLYGDEPLPYASIHVKGSTYGVISNAKGNYFIELPNGSYTLVCEYIGMQGLEKQINVTSDMHLNFEMLDENEQLGTAVVDANDEDPAYDIIRKAIAKKKDLNHELETYVCNLYLKASLEKEDLTKPDSGNSQPLTKQRVNFVESYSEVYYKNGKFKEVKKAYNDLASKKSNTTSVSINFNDQHPTESYQVISPELFFTKITDGNFNFLKNRLQIPVLSDVPLTSPIASTAFLSYKYKLLETFYEGNDFIAKIRVTPKYDQGGLFSGVIYISKNTFTLKSVDLSVNDGVLNFFNHFNLIQDFELKSDSFLMTTRQEFYYVTRKSKKKASYGHTLASYTNFKLHPKLSDRFMNRAQVVYETEEGESDQEFWSSVRPTGLKQIEMDFVRVQDSIRAYHKSDAYLDMQDSIANDLNVWDYLLNGVVYRNHRKGLRFYFSPLIAQFRINNIDGYRHTLGSSIDKRWSKEKQLHVGGEIGYGLTNKNIRGHIETKFMYNPVKFSRVRLRYANEYTMISNTASIASTLSPSNFAENIGYGIGHEQEWLNGFFVRAHLDYDQYGPFTGQTLEELWDLFPKFSEAQDFEPFQEMVLSIDARITFKQQYELHKYKKVITGSRYPVLSIKYNKGIKPFLSSDVNYDYLELSTQYAFKLFKMGTTRTQFAAGRFLNDREVRLSGLKYIRGSDNWYFSNPLRTAQLLQSQGYQTAKGFAQAGIMHHFNGAILGKVPVIKRTGIQLAGGAHGMLLEYGYLNLDESTNQSGGISHIEAMVGLERPTRIWGQMFRFGFYYAVGQNSQDGFSEGFKFGIDFYNTLSHLWQY